ncbi:MAG: wax ester/triacylglycerol synthase family O-acyltransferase [Rhodobacteraceae bacterium]|nr:wax ester/triacylglycerol synthase family O-acyltransferase [Paracoccaceae bacterium]
MKQLSGLDASFLYLETEQSPMHVAGLTLYDKPVGFKGSFYKHFRTFFEGRVHLIKVFGKKLAKTVMQMDHPGWVDAGDLDMDYHLQSIKLPKPGTMKQLEDTVAELHADLLDRKKPLWQFHVIEGLQSGQVALYSKVHHAAIDGGAGVEITKALYDLTPEPREVRPPEPKVEERKPTTPERAILNLHDLATNAMRQQLAAIEAVPKVMGQMTNLLTPLLNGALGLPQLVAPKTAFNVSIDKKRSYAARTVSALEMKAISKATGTKLNDVVMAVCGGALRTYFQEKRALPDAALVAFVPISTREAGDSAQNNQVFGMTCSLATNYGDPLKRLKIVARDSGTSKAFAGSVKDAAPTDFTMLGAPWFLPGLVQMYQTSRLADTLPNVANVTISNVPGPPVPLFCAGAQVTDLYPVSIPANGVAVNITLQTYMGKLHFGITADHKALPDADYLCDLLVSSFEELRDLVLTDDAAETA